MVGTEQSGSAGTAPARPSSNLGAFISSQRRAAEMSLRQLAAKAGVSNPYVSQIERGLRKPSAEVLQQLAKALRISAESLYVRAGILDPEEARLTSVERAIQDDSSLTEAHQQALLALYHSFLAADRPETDAATEGTSGGAPGATAQPGTRPVDPT